MKYKKADFSGFGIVVAIAIAIIVIFFLSLYLYPRIQEAGLLGIKIAEGPQVAEGSSDLIVKADDENFNCDEEYVNVFNVCEHYIEDVEVDISDGFGFRTVVVDLPGGAVLPLLIEAVGGAVTVEVDPANNIAEVSENNNLATRNPCP
ncbi:MAG: hypothetical protein JSW73_04905 [Candidatus Woesearchaeota archaeon]|nr:MAG: hypothetical protein JSW73_04905 [Candidatus Woesearchaeota archaeon]